MNCPLPDELRHFSHTTSLRLILMFLHLRPSLKSGPFLSGSSTKILYVYTVSHSCYMSHLPHSIRYVRTLVLHRHGRREETDSIMSIRSV